MMKRILAALMLLLLLCAPAALGEEANFYVVHYDANGVDVSVPGDVVKKPGEDVWIDSITFAPFGRNCLGWSTDPDASEPEYVREDYYTKDENVTLYAVWAEPWDLGEIADGRTWSYEKTYEFGDMWFTFTVPEDGWYCLETTTDFKTVSWGSGEGIFRSEYQQMGGAYHADGDFWFSAELEAGVTYYLGIEANYNDLGLMAHKVENLVTYSANGEDAEVPDTIAKLPGQTVEIEKLPALSNVFGKICLGWSTDPDAVTAQYTGGETYTEDAPLTLYAVWADAYDMGELDDGKTWEFENPYRYCYLYMTFTVPEDGWYFLESTNEFKGSSWNSGEGVYKSRYNQIGSSELRGRDIAITAELEAGVTYYLYLRTNENDLTLRAREIEAIVSYDMNGKKISAPKPQAKLAGEPLEIAGDTPSLFPYTHLGWSTDPAATEAEYVRGDTYTGSEDITLYAVWENVRDLGEITGRETWTRDHIYDYCTMYMTFTVSESGTYLFETEGDFNTHTSGSSNCISTNEYNSISSYDWVDHDVRIVADLEAGVTYYLSLRANYNDLILHCIPQYEDKPFEADVILPRSLSAVPEEAFAGSSVESVMLGEGTLTVASRAFADCAELTKIIVPSAETILAEDCLDGVTQEVVIVAPEDSAAYDFAKAQGLDFRRLDP
ncbi:MAG: InlB B-repeat-containing protein [Clostridia bacterium]|nr:InlB B-repeat-containing protein [Clostridia bacterium]